MSAPEPGILNTDHFGVHKQHHPPPPPQSAASSQPLIHAMQLAYNVDGTAVYKPVPGNGPPPPSYNARPAGNGNGNSEGINVNIGVEGGGIGGGGGSDQAKKRRGRPRKYGPDGPMPVPFLSPAPPSVNQSPVGGNGGFASPHLPPQHQQQQYLKQQVQQNHHHHQQPPQQQQQAHQHQQQGMVVGQTVEESPVKKARGRPPGSINRKKLEQQQQHQHQQQQPAQQQQVDAMGAPGIGFTPHVITVNTGEDVSSKIMSFSQNGPRAICILSAIGAISNVTLRQAATSGGSVTYEGRFEILSLSGSFMLSENGGGRSRTGGLSVSLAGPDGRVVGGGVAGLLTAASPVQVVVGSFIADGQREPKMPNQTDTLFTQSRVQASAGPPGTNSPPSRGTLSESSGGPGSPMNHNAAAVNSAPPGISSLPWK